jgi:3-oxoacyl-[acyl-carrier-protein] synthase-3
MATKAGLDALSGSGIKPEELDMIIVATMSSEYTCPSVSCLVQDAIGAEKAFCFDISAACSGFLFALNTAEQYIKTGKAQNVLIIGSEKLSQLTNWEDRNTCVLFGDGAGAAVVVGSDEPGILDGRQRSI